ncbi:J domain-containing protein [Arthrobacter sp. PAMC 25486]|uniref:J domain-containing protein n=1 Tax=Arthrobacter sp. PAMC 25486 TaxID=1494608 RepID=UPI0012FF5413
MTAAPDFYAVLHLAPDATTGDVGRAYRSLLRRHHPDTAPVTATPAHARRERELLQEIMDAHAVLADPVQRALYDRQLAGAASGPGPSARAPVSRPATSFVQPAIIVGPLWWEPPVRRCI